MVTSNIKTPGVYIDEVNAFPNSVVPVATAVPAFIGYTPTAEYQGKSYFNKAQKITSFAEFQSIYMNGNPPPPADPATQYSPEYYLVEQKDKPTTGDYMMIGGSYYSIVPDPNSIYYLYNSVRLFYQNGGGDAYIVSVGTYGAASGKPGDVGAQIVNPNVKLSDLKSGLDLLQYEQEPTIYICPEATLLSVADNGTLMQEMLLQAGSMQTAVCMFDVIGGNTPDPITYTNDIETFRNNTGSNSLNYGVAYYPFIGTTIMQSSEINYTNLFGGDVKQLEPLLNPASAPNPTASKIISMIEANDGSMTTSQLNAALLNASQTYSQIVNHVLSDANLLPPSGGMAGVYTVNDNVKGVWGAPANTSIVGASSLPIRLNDTQQAGLNVDAVSGKSINAIRFFNGQGILVWGARTLDGNSQDWRYVSVRRTMTFLEQSCKLAARAYVFAANDANTWGAVKSEIGSFLMSIWKEGGLQGAKASDAFQVECGLGTTMTSDDILNGFMKVSVKVAIVHPAEFIVISFEQEMAKSG
ncbi:MULTISPECIES: phage tail sheath family protein [Pseudoalteromonas]|uniref:Phage tail protein n=1 Tax=Pseudoalteromonas amylolytica TaxID=1859457 RepID=A0A1S1MTY2_9GAMM|nr:MULTISPECIES: phage tail sheath C-terminal domain-containing protein [Pseudoalteromonas]MCF6437561.1 phage tail sheath subtilisin-like domain-containing protein [Pseudoalteromonas sp. MMG022]OHU84965.1 phage tail protein [Pseudoalteromonas sp. JW3]OHU90084.1 phage tail protein [Pseudoalteromonas amylolytica]